MPTIIPGIGRYVRDWRDSRGEDHHAWANTLYSGGFRLSASVSQLAKDLQDIEDADVWPYAVPEHTAFDFAGACRREFVHSARDLSASTALNEFLACYFLHPLGVHLTHPCPGDPTR
jgi:hypothetical protein